MRIQHRYISFEENRKLLKVLNKLSVRCDITDRTIGENARIYALEFCLYEDNPRFEEVKKEIDEFGIHPQVGTVFEPDDMANANWFWVNSGEYQYPQPEDSFGLGRSFDLSNYCNFCGIGANQNAPIRLKSHPKQPKNDFWGIHWLHDVIFVRQRAKKILEDAAVNNISFSHPVLHKNSLVIEELDQLHIHTVLPPGFSSANTITETCGKAHEPVDARLCGGAKYNFPARGGLTFERTIFDNQPDIVLTNEYFGSGASAFRLPLFSKRLKTIIDCEKLRGLHFTPIFH